jgi:hypothetical protein
MHKGRADFRVPVEKREMALRYARLVTGSRIFAAAASFGAKQHATSDELCGLLKRYNEDMLKALKAEPRNETVTSQFQFCTEMTTILFSEEEAELLRRRARAHTSRPMERPS